MLAFLSNLLHTCEQEQISYCLLRDGERLEQAAQDGELDLLVPANQFQRLCDLLTSHGFVRLPAWGHAPHRFFVGYCQEADRWLKLDVVTDVSYGKRTCSIRTPLAHRCLQNRRREGSAWTLSPQDEFLTLLLHCTLDKHQFSPLRSGRLLSLRRVLAADPEMQDLLATYWSPTMGWNQVARHLDAGDWQALLKHRRAVTRHLTRGGHLGTHCRGLRDRLLRKLGKWSGLSRPRAISVAILAPDGAGKSTLIASIQKSFYFSTRSIHMGLYRKEQPRGARARIKGFGLLGNLLTQWRHYLVARYHQARGRLVMFDRYTYDALLPTRQHLNWLRRWRRQLLAHACPSPDLVVMLDAPGEVLFARKGEHSVELLERQRQSYLALAPHVPQMVVVDATRDPDCVYREVTSVIWRGLAQRWERRRPA